MRAREPRLLWAAALAVLTSAPAWAAEDRVVVMTSFPDAMVARYEAAFEKANPGIDMQVVWKMPRDALAHLRQPNQGGIDVYWSSARTNYPVLRDEGRLRPLTIDRAGLPGKLGAQPLSDPRFYEAFEMAGYGLVASPAYMQKHGLTQPQRWPDLADPRFAGHIAMPIASRVPFAGQMYDIILQNQGWTQGWQLLMDIGANAQPIENGGAVAEKVVLGEAAIGLTIDFQGLNAVAGGRPVTFSYPRGSAFLMSSVAITRDAAHPSAAQIFFDYTLSNDGQKLMFHPDISRYPVRPDAYAAAPAGWQYNPFAMAQTEGMTFPYDLETGLAREAMVISLFDKLITERLADLRDLAANLRDAEAWHAKNGNKAALAAIKEARNLAWSVPVTNEQAADRNFVGVFDFEKRRSSKDADAKAVALETEWKKIVGQNHAKAVELLKSIGTSPMTACKTACKTFQIPGVNSVQ